MEMQTQSTYYLRTLILGVTAAMASCLLALALAAPPAQAATQRGDLSVSQTDGPDPLESGYLTYTLTVKHELGDCGWCYWSGAIRLEDTLPSDANVIEINTPTRTKNYDTSVDVSCTATNGVTCTIDGLYDGDSVDIVLVVRSTMAGAQTLTNTATVSSADSYYSTNYPDPDTTNNTSTATTQVGESYTPPPGCASVCPNTTLTDTPGEFSSNVSPSFSFASSEANSTFECKLDAGAFQSCPSPKRYFLLSEGQHTFQVRAKNASGAVDPIPAQYTWTVDSLDPKITFTQRPGIATGPEEYDEWFTNDTSPTWAWTVTEANPITNPEYEWEQDYCSLYDPNNDRYIFRIYGCSSPFPFEGELPDGDYLLEIYVNDKAGNIGGAYNYLTVDTAAPAAPVISAPANNSYDTDGSIAIGGTAEAYATVRIFEGTTLKGTAEADYAGRWSKTVSGVANGPHTYAARATDRAGNASAGSSNFRRVTVDTVKPRVLSTAPLAGATGVLPGTNVTATFSEAMTAAAVNRTTFKLVKRGTTTAIGATVTYDAATKKATLNPTANLAAGATYTATVTTGAKDLAGNGLDQAPTLAGLQPKSWSFTVKR